MASLLILNGSPRAPRSNSKRYGQMLASCWSGTAESLEITRRNHPELCAKVGEASHLVFVFPLYADGLPVTLLNFLKALEAAPPRSRPTVSVLINCGFLEPGQNEIAVEMMRLFCKQNQYPFGSVLMIGSGEAILDSPFRFLAARKIRRFSGSIARGAYGTFRTTMPLTKGIFIKAAASYWTNYGKKFGTSKEEMQTMQIE